MKSKIINRQDLIDDTILRSLIGDDDEKLLLVYLAFLDSGLEILKELSFALAAQDINKILNAAHKLKSSALSVGANGVGKCANNIESLIHADRPTQDISTEFERLNEQFALVEDIIRR